MYHKWCNVQTQTIRVSSNFDAVCLSASSRIWSRTDGQSRKEVNCKIVTNWPADPPRYMTNQICQSVVSARIDYGKLQAIHDPRWGASGKQYGKTEIWL